MRASVYVCDAHRLFCLISEKVVPDEIKRELFLDTQSTFDELYTDEGYNRTNSAVQSNVVLFNGLTTLNNLPLHPTGPHARKYIQGKKLKCLPRHSWTCFESLCGQDGVLQVQDSHLLAEAGQWLWCRGQCGLVSGGVERGDTRWRIMVCGLGCLAPNGGRLDEVLRQPCNTLGDSKNPKKPRFEKCSPLAAADLRVRARYRTYWFRAGTDSIFKSAELFQAKLRKQADEKLP